MQNPTDEQVLLASAALEAAGLSVSGQQLLTLIDHLCFVIEANQRARLTAIDSFPDGVRLHVVDSLLVLPEVASAPDGPMLDMGTGGGYPGIPLSVMTGRHVDLVDSVGKKARLVQEFIDSREGLGVEARALPVRLEKILGHSPAGGYAVAVARALSSLPALVELAAPALALGGHLIAMKGDLSDDELARGDRAAKLVGLERCSVRRYELPPTGEKRAAVVYRRKGKPSVALPRREGLAQRQPLA